MTLNVSKVNELAHSNETALAIAEELSREGRRNRAKTVMENVYKVLTKKGLKIVEADFNRYWKDLEAAGVGSVVYGRKGNSDRFIWNYNLKDVANAALTGKGEVIRSESQPIPQKQAKKLKRGRPKGSKNKKKGMFSNSEMKLLKKLLSRLG